MYHRLLSYIVASWSPKLLRCHQCFELFLAEDINIRRQLPGGAKHTVTVINPLLFPVGWIDVKPSLPFKCGLAGLPTILGNMFSQRKGIFIVFDIHRPGFYSLGRTQKFEL